MATAAGNNGEVIELITLPKIDGKHTLTAYSKYLPAQLHGVPSVYTSGGTTGGTIMHTPLTITIHHEVALSELRKVIGKEYKEDVSYVALITDPNDAAKLIEARRITIGKARPVAVEGHFVGSKCAVNVTFEFQQIYFGMKTWPKDGSAGVVSFDSFNIEDPAKTYSPSLVLK